ncbi:hypothetical protein [Streptomyces sp. NBC_00038]|uniref:hypothetical protein n=1 Tax=Streptomyces sp. NBC_00038 TaxID=2903615 RepID=UPI002252C0E1|nr:hypothetical protein [Streptomyces sp. NBC_00038]MCX5558380.1 hypothetical protein [Streptomyces sp. NBC_00038]
MACGNNHVGGSHLSQAPTPVQDLGRIAVEEALRSERAAAVKRTIANWRATTAQGVAPEGMRLKNPQNPQQDPSYSHMGDWKGGNPVPGTEKLVHTWHDEHGQPVQGNAYPHIHVIHDPYKGEVRVELRRLKGPESIKVRKPKAGIETATIPIDENFSGTQVNEAIERLAGILRNSGPYR